MQLRSRFQAPHGQSTHRKQPKPFSNSYKPQRAQAVYSEAEGALQRTTDAATMATGAAAAAPRAHPHEVDVEPFATPEELPAPDMLSVGPRNPGFAATRGRPCSLAPR